MADAVGSDRALLGSTASGFTYANATSLKKKRGLIFALIVITVLIAGIIIIIYIANNNNSNSSNSDVTTPAPIAYESYLLHSSHINVAQVDRVSRFRSSVGGDWPGFSSPTNINQTCACFKHYFRPISSLDFTRVSIFSPLAGTINRVQIPEGRTDGSYGWDVSIRGTTRQGYGEYLVTIGHVNITDHSAISKDKSIALGAVIGHHIGAFVDSDIAVLNMTANRYLSMFSCVDEDVLAQFKRWNVSNRTYPIINDLQRRRYPLNCTGDGTIANGFIVNDTNNGYPYANWMKLNTTAGTPPSSTTTSTTSTTSTTTTTNTSNTSDFDY